MNRKPTINFIFHIGGKDHCATLSGQTAIALEALVSCGSMGVATQEVASWALRFSAYIHKLRRDHGLVIDMEREAHSGPAGKGWHGRYFLRTPVKILEDAS